MYMESEKVMTILRSATAVMIQDVTMPALVGALVDHGTALLYSTLRFVAS